jgi:hypothetical protein
VSVDVHLRRRVRGRETPLVSIARSQPGNDRLRLCRRSMDCCARGRPGSATDQRCGSGKRARVLPGRQHDCIYRGIRRQHGCVHHPCRGRYSASSDLSSRPGRRRRMDSGRKADFVSLHARIGEPLHAALFRSRRGWCGCALAAAHGLSGPDVAGRLAHSLLAAGSRIRIRLHGIRLVGKLSRRPRQHHLDHRACGTGLGRDSSRSSVRLLSRLLRPTDLFPLRACRPHRNLPV